MRSILRHNIARISVVIQLMNLPLATILSQTPSSTKIWVIAPVGLSCRQPAPLMLAPLLRVPLMRHLALHSHGTYTYTTQFLMWT